MSMTYDQMFSFDSKSIYSYIDDLVIANCLIDARVFVNALSHISFAILLCEHVGMHVLFIQGQPFFWFS